MKKIIIPVILILAVLGGLYLWYGQSDKNEEAMISEVVVGFGQSLKNVSLLAPDAPQSIRDSYGSFLSPGLINQWADDTSKALGRPASSPWPDSIEIAGFKRESPVKYSVSGNIIEMTSAGAAGKRGITLVVEKINDNWLITSISLAPYDPSSGWLTYTEDNFFSLKYPPEFPIQTGEGIGGAFLENSMVKVSFPDSARDNKTNYAEAYVVVSSSDSFQSCTSFSDFPYLNNPQPETKVINGIEFKVEPVSDAGAGNLYTSHLYRTLHNGICYELSLTVHTGNIYNYPEGMVTEFDQSKAFNILEEIANTFQFLK